MPKNRPASHGIDSAAARSSTAQTPLSYQNVAEDSYLDADIIARRKKERQERHKDDPFYIFAPGGEEITDADLEAIPVMELKLDDVPHAVPQEVRRPVRERVVVVMDEGIDGDDGLDEEEEDKEKDKKGKGKKKGGLLGVDASGLVGYSLEGGEEKKNDYEEEKEARKEVERLRKEMEAAAEKVREREEMEKAAAKKTKKVKKTVEGEGKKKKKVKKEGETEGEAGEKKKKKKKVKKEGEGEAEGDGAEKKKKKKIKKEKTVEEDTQAATTVAE
jgi:AP-3 complex subunit delta-1